MLLETANELGRVPFAQGRGIVDAVQLLTLADATIKSLPMAKDHTSPRSPVATFQEERRETRTKLPEEG